MTEYISRSNVIAFVQRWHEGDLREDGTPMLGHLMRVGERAEELIRKVYCRRHQFICAPNALQADYVFCAGILHDAVEHTDLDFENVLDMSNIVVAQYVSDLSFDRRLPPPRRIVEYASRLASAPFEVKLIKLVDIVDDLRNALAMFNRNSPADLASGLLRWSDDARKCLAAIGRELRNEFVTRDLEAEAHQLVSDLIKKIGGGQAMKSVSVAQQREDRRECIRLSPQVGGPATSAASERLTAALRP